MPPYTNHHLLAAKMTAPSTPSTKVGIFAFNVSEDTLDDQTVFHLAITPLSKVSCIDHYCVNEWTDGHLPRSVLSFPEEHKTRMLSYDWVTMAAWTKSKDHFNSVQSNPCRNNLALCRQIAPNEIAWGTFTSTIFLMDNVVRPIPDPEGGMPALHQLPISAGLISNAFPYTGEEGFNGILGSDWLASNDLTIVQTTENVIFLLCQSSGKIIAKAMNTVEVLSSSEILPFLKGMPTPAEKWTILNTTTSGTPTVHQHHPWARDEDSLHSLIDHLFETYFGQYHQPAPYPLEGNHV